MFFLIRHLLQLLLSIPAILLSIAAFCLFTTPGTKYLLEGASYLTNQKFQAELLEGHIGTPIGLKNISWNSETLEVSIQHLYFNWDPRTLLTQGIWHFKTLDINNALIQYHPMSTNIPHKPFIWPTIVIDHLSGQALTWIDPTHHLPIDTLLLKGQQIGNTWQIDSLQLKLPQGTITGHGHITPQEQIQLQLDLNQIRPLLGNNTRASLSGAMQIDVHILQNQWYWTIDTEKLSGSLADQPLKGHFYAEGVQQQLSKADIDLTIGESHIELQANMAIEKSYLYGEAKLKNFPDFINNRLLNLKSHLEWDQQTIDTGQFSFYLDTPELYLPLDIQKLSWHRKQDQWHFSGPGKLGPHLFKTEGVWHSAPTPSLEAKLSGQSMVYDNHLDTKIIISPDLNFSWAPTKWRLNGTLVIPEATIIRTQHQNSIRLSEDVEIIDPNKPPTVVQIHQSHIHLDLLLGNKVHFQGYGLDTYLNGKLKLQYANQTLSTTGEVDFVKGKYKAFGRIFDITQGYLQYGGGAITEPQILIRAQRTIIPTNTNHDASFNPTPIVVGVNLTGIASNPKMRLFSTPSMAEPDILSYLLLNRAQTDLTHDQANILLQAAGALSDWAHPKDSNLKMPFDELRLEHKDTQKITPTLDTGNSTDGNAGPNAATNALSQTALVVGKQINDKLYVQYQGGIVDTLNTLHIKYILGKNLTLEADTGVEASGADLVWSFDGR